MIHSISSLPAEFYLFQPAKQSLNKRIILKDCNYLAEYSYHPKNQLWIRKTVAELHFSILSHTKLSKFMETKQKIHKKKYITNTYREANARLFGVRYKVWSARKDMKFILSPESENLWGDFLRSRKVRLSNRKEERFLPVEGFNGSNNWRRRGMMTHARVAFLGRKCIGPTFFFFLFYNLKNYS